MDIKANTCLIMYFAQFFLECEMFQTKVVEKMETRFVLNIFFLNGVVYEITWKKYCRPWQAALDTSVKRRMNLGC
jgi:hypothetical protein